MDVSTDAQPVAQEQAATEAAPVPETAPPEKRKGHLGLIVFIVVALLVVAFVAVAVFHVDNGLFAPASTPKTVTQPTPSSQAAPVQYKVVYRVSGGVLTTLGGQMQAYEGEFRKGSNMKNEVEATYSGVLLMLR